MAFIRTELPINGLLLIEPKVFGDHRGYFFECYNKRDFEEIGIRNEFVQDNQSKSGRGVLRGLHFQRKHPQGKFVRVISGLVWDVAVDLRDGSPSFGKYHGVVLSGEKNNMFFIPEGFAHGFVVLSDEAVFTYMCTDYYHPEDEEGIIWNDPIIAIDWPMETTEITLSDRDGSLPCFKLGNVYFDETGCPV